MTNARTIADSAGEATVLDVTAGTAAASKAVVLDGSKNIATLGTVASGALTVTGASTITTADNTDTLTLTSTDADANSGPNLKLIRDSSSPADGDVGGVISFVAENDASEAILYSEIKSLIDDMTDGTEDGRLFFNTMVAGSLTERLRFNGVETAFNEGSADLDFRVESNGDANMLFVDGGNNAVGIATNSPLLASGRGMVVHGGASIARVELRNDDSGGAATDGGFLTFGGNQDLFLGNRENATVQFWNNGSERMRIQSDGTLLVGKTSSGITNVGVEAASDKLSATVASANVCYFNRETNDGSVVIIYGDGNDEGGIGVSGNTVQFNGFTGSHWSRLADNSKPTILRGTIMESIDEMCDWYQAVADVAEVNYTAEDQEVIDGDKNVGDVKTEAYKVKESIALGDKSIGDAITFTSNGTEYTGTIVKEDDVKHNKCKVSDTADSKKVYGVFSHWDDADDGLDGDVNDMNIAQVGTYIIRVNKDEVVQGGDLLVSNGDGTVKVQDDDIIRSKTVAKVNSNIKIETYSDGSYTVPCTLHC